MATAAADEHRVRVGQFRQRHWCFPDDDLHIVAGKIRNVVAEEVQAILIPFDGEDLSPVGDEGSFY